MSFIIWSQLKPKSHWRLWFKISPSSSNSFAETLKSLSNYSLKNNPMNLNLQSTFWSNWGIHQAKNMNFLLFFQISQVLFKFVIPSFLAIFEVKRCNPVSVLSPLFVMQWFVILHWCIYWVKSAKIVFKKFYAPRSWDGIKFVTTL